MSNLDNLTQKILDDAKDKAESIYQEAAKKSEDIINSRVKEAKMKETKIVEKATSEGKMMKDRIISNGELRVRDEKLKVKQEVLNRVFSIAKKNLTDLDEEKYINFVKTNINNMKLKGTEEFIVPEKFTDKVKALGLNVSQKETVESGFLVKDKDVVINFSFDSLVDYFREELEGEISAKLFK